MDVALRHFEILYSTFSLRSWVPSANCSLCRDQYIQLLDRLRYAYGPGFDITSVSGDSIEFLYEQEFLRDRSCLFYLFKLCCLCATYVSPTYPDVTVRTVSTVGRQRRLTDVIRPGQSYMVNVRDSVASYSDDKKPTTTYRYLIAQKCARRSRDRNQEQMQFAQKKKLGRRN